MTTDGSVTRDGVFIDRVLVSGRADTTPPGPATELEATGTSRQVEVSFVAPGDDHAAGRADRYIVRMADRPIVDGEADPGSIAFARATDAPAPAPGPAGSRESITIPMAPGSTERDLYVAIKAVDEAGNVGEMATTAAVVPGADFHFRDSSDSEGNWQTESWTRVRVARDPRGFVWTDSAYSSYAANRDTALTSRTISLAEVAHPWLTFELKRELNRGDRLLVEVTEMSGEARAQTTEVARYAGNGNWGGQQLDLAAFAGKDVQITFRLTTDATAQGDGVYIDDVSIVDG